MLTLLLTFIVYFLPLNLYLVTSTFKKQKFYFKKKHLKNVSSAGLALMIVHSRDSNRDVSVRKHDRKRRKAKEKAELNPVLILTLILICGQGQRPSYTPGATRSQRWWSAWAAEALITLWGSDLGKWEATTLVATAISHQSSVPTSIDYLQAPGGQSYHMATVPSTPVFTFQWRFIVIRRFLYKSLGSAFLPGSLYGPVGDTFDPDLPTLQVKPCLCKWVWHDGPLPNWLFAVSDPRWLNNFGSFCRFVSTLDVDWSFFCTSLSIWVEFYSSFCLLFLSEGSRFLLFPSFVWVSLSLSPCVSLIVLKATAALKPSESLGQRTAGVESHPAAWGL